MTIEEKIAMNERNIRRMLEDYGRHTWDQEVLQDVSEAFIKRLAKDSTIAKEGLRQLFRKSPAWDEELDAIVINGNRTHEPDYSVVKTLARTILNKPLEDAAYPMEYRRLNRAIDYFVCPNIDEYDLQTCIDAINEIAPGAYAPGKKKSRIFRDICVALGVADMTAGSEFQKLYAQFADELSSKQIGFKLIVSINPAHFLSMSNPKRDSRGTTLTSCHSFNSTDYSYNNGCSGYARDEVTFLVFTVKDFSDKESLNNRKTTRQVFCYKPGNGLLLQSRLYNTSGGTRGAQSESQLYRDLVQREISELEGQPNLWNTFRLCGNSHGVCFDAGCGFGGYTDWDYSDFVPMVSIRNDHADDYEPFEIGTYGLCIMCAEETSDGVYCDDCFENTHRRCDRCDDPCREEDLHEAYDYRGNLVMVCESCLDNYYRRCDICGEYHDVDAMTQLADGDWVCRDCRDEHCSRCERCGEWVRDYDTVEVYDEDCDTVILCDDCDDAWSECTCCGKRFLNSALFMGICPNCQEDHDEVSA